jgi:hypothetical protein
MSIKTTLVEWSRRNGYRLVHPVYLKDWQGDSLRDGDARLVRHVAPEDRNTKKRNPQRYTIEAMCNDTISYPLGQCLPKEDLLFAMLADLRKGN